MGYQMEKQAIDFLPELFKILVISVQVSPLSETLLALEISSYYSYV